VRLAALALLVVGCGPDKFVEFRDQYVSRLCENLRHCGQLGDHDPCPVPSTLPSAGGLDVPSAIDDDKLAFHSDHAQRCLDELENVPCDPRVIAIRIYEHCHNVIGPNVGSGEGCRVDAECVGGTCDGSFACPGHCVPYPPPGAACLPGDCDPTVQFCADGKCRPHQPQEADCTDDDQCAYPFFCADGKCRHHPRVPDGKECGFSDAICDDNRYCSPATGVCTVLRAPGLACDAREACIRDHGCALAGDGGACRPWPDDGQPCVAGLCPLSQSCVAGGDGGNPDAGLPGTCRADPTLPAGPHEGCSERACQDGLFCNHAKTCEYQRLLAGSCTIAEASCADGLACDPVDNRCKPPQMTTMCVRPDLGVVDSGGRD
jgi:hypothetical protein